MVAAFSRFIVSVYLANLAMAQVLIKPSQVDWDIPQISNNASVTVTKSSTVTVATTATFISKATPPAETSVPVFFRYCMGSPDETENPKCEGACMNAWRDCYKDGRDTDNRIKTETAGCVETNSTVPFKVCDRKDSCNSHTNFHPGSNTRGMKVYNTPKTAYIVIECPLDWPDEGQGKEQELREEEYRKELDRKEEHRKE